MSTFIPEQAKSTNAPRRVVAHGTEQQANQAAQNAWIRAWALLQRLEAALDRRRERRQLQGADDVMLKDIGIPQCGVEWALCNGREQGEESPRRGDEGSGPGVG
jgi:uncharacterized protein YjiS (DUF1127 family)